MDYLWAEIAERHQTQQQIQFLKTQLKPQERVLDAACGTGRHTMALCKEGFNVVGLDVSPNLLRMAKNKGALWLVRGDLRALPFKAEAFSAIISVDNSFGYLPSKEQDQNSLVEARRVLRSEGILLLDVFNRERLVHKYGLKPVAERLFEYPSFQLKQLRTVSRDGDWLCDHWTITEHTGKKRVFRHKVHLYTFAQLEEMLSNAYFAVDAVYGDYENQPFDQDSKRLIMRSIAK
jgi:ubiquinone/menaquinone biosynthesis C-methylase UbiE